MPKCNNWTLELEGEKDLCLIINGKRISDLLSDYESQGIDMFKSSFVKSIFDDGKDMVKVTVNQMHFTLDCNKMISSVVLGWNICDKKNLLEFWNVLEEVLTEKDGNIAPASTCSMANKGLTLEEKNNLENNDSVNTNDNNLSDIEETDKEFQQTNLFDSIKSKSVGQYYLDILKLKTPPSDFQVRERHEEFVEKIALAMIEKRNISIDNAANVIAFIKVEKSDFKEEMLEKYPIYVHVIDGNHNVKAQTIAYDRTKDWIFKSRMVHIYCNLTPEEGLVLGTSRNEDSSTVLRFSDFEKISLVRRYLYSSTQTAMNDEPPEPHKGFSAIYKQLLNLKTKKEVDSKAIIRFLATKLSSRNYDLFSSICNNSFIRASRFECLRGLEDDEVYNELYFLETSSKSRLDWRTFRHKCLKYRKKNTQRKLTVQIQFNETCTKADISTNERSMLTDCVSFTFTSADGSNVKTLSAREVELLVFGSYSIPKRVQKKRKTKPVLESCSDEDEEQSDVGKELNKCITKLSPSKVMPNVYKRHLVALEGAHELPMSKQILESCSDEEVGKESLFSPFVRTSTPVKESYESLFNPLRRKAATACTLKPVKPVTESPFNQLRRKAATACTLKPVKPVTVIYNGFFERFSVIFHDLLVITDNNNKEAMIGIKFEPVEISPSVYSSTSEDMIFSVMKSFIGDVLTETFASKVSNGRYPDSLGMTDVFQALNNMSQSDFLTNMHLGVKATDSSNVHR